MKKAIKPTAATIDVDNLDVIMITPSALARLLDRSDRRIRALSQNNTLPRPVKGLYPLAATIGAFLERQAELAEVSTTSTSSEERQARARTWASRAIMAELDVAARRRQLVSRDEVLGGIKHALILARTTFQAIPSRLAPHFSRSAPGAAFVLLQTAIDRALNDYADNLGRVCGKEDSDEETTTNDRPQQAGRASPAAAHAGGADLNGEAHADGGEGTTPAAQGGRQ